MDDLAGCTESIYKCPSFVCEIFLARTMWIIANLQRDDKDEKTIAEDIFNYLDGEFCQPGDIRHMKAYLLYQYWQHTKDMYKNAKPHLIEAFKRLIEKSGLLSQNTTNVSNRFQSTAVKRSISTEVNRPDHDDFINQTSKVHRILLEISETLDKIENDVRNNSAIGKQGRLVFEDVRCKKLRQSELPTDRVDLDLDTITSEYTETRKAIFEQFRNIFSNWRKHLELLYLCIESWKESHKKAYIKVGHQFNTNILKDGCTEACKLILKMIKLLNTDDYQNMISSPNITNQILIDQEAKIHEDIETQLKKDFITLFKRCFVVEVEPTDVQKVTGTGEKGSKKGKGKGKAGGKDEEVKSNKSGPEFTVTVAILCARGLEWTNVMKPVKAKLQYEDNQRAGGGLVSGELSVPQVAIGKDGVADFRKQKIIKFVRPEKNKKEEQVTSERYRIVFETNLSIQNPEISIELKTMSLPIAIITGSNQANSSHGALLWYCYNTDPYLLHTLPPSIPTEKFKEMIQACFKYLDGRPLRNDEMDFLLAKLFKQDDTQVNPVFKHEVRFEDFEVTNKKNPRSTEDKSIPFWRWLQAILNLIEFFLLKPWQDGVIHGFVSRQRTDELLRREPDGVFLLRFSESRVVGDGQNKNLTGALVAAFSLGGGKTIHGLPLTVESYFNKYSLFAVLNGIQNAGKGRHLLKKLYGTQTTIKDFKALYNDKCDKKDKTEENNSRYPNWSEQTLLMLSDKMNEMMNIDDDDEDDDDDDYDDDNSVSNGESKRKIPRVRQDSMSSSVHSPETPNNTFEQEFHAPMDETAPQGSSIPSNAVDNLLATHNQHSVPSTSTFTFTPFQNSMILQGSIIPSVTMCSSEAYHQQTIGQMSSPTNQTSGSFPNPSLPNVSPVHNVMQSPTNTPNPMIPGCQYPTPIVYGETTWATVSRLSSQNSLPNNIDSSSIPLTAQEFITLNGPDNIDDLEI